jgi:hypothetical protein
LYLRASPRLFGSHLQLALEWPFESHNFGSSYQFQPRSGLCLPRPLTRCMKKPRLKWNLETIVGLLIFAILGLYYVVLLFLFLLVKYL